jgi:unsaturated chondroitin disaccharide hydrolase
MTAGEEPRPTAERTEAAARSLLVERTASTLEQVEEGFPYVADPDTGVWEVTANGNWCGGHWIGMLWLAYERTGEDRFAEAAERYTAKLFDAMPADNMFYGMNATYAGFRAYDVTDYPRHLAIGVAGAERTVEYFHEGARQVPLGTLGIEAPASNFRGPGGEDGPSGARLGAVDAIYTALPVLWRAYRETGRERYRDVAVSHADRHLDWYVRSDGSTWHHAEFDPETGALVRQYNELAYSQETCWARGQGWCIAGVARAYRETQAQRYLDALRRVVDYYVEHAPSDLVPYWDFEHPDPRNAERDTSAAALAAYGLTGLPETPETERLVDIGERILTSLFGQYLTPRTDEDERPPGMVLESCYNGPAQYANRHEHVWTDYYLFYALTQRATRES